MKIDTVPAFDRPLETDSRVAPLNLPEGELFRTIADYTYDWEYLVSPSNQLTYCSPSCLQITGYPAEAFLADPGLLINIVHPDDRQRYLEHVMGQLDNPTPGSIDYRILHADGSVRWLGHKCQPAFDSRGQYQGKRISNRDITDLKTAEQSLLQLNRDLESRVDEHTALLRAEIATRKQIERELKTRLRIEHTLAKISASFIELQDFDVTVNSTLRSIGQLAQAKRVGLYCSRDYGGYFECTHEWCCPRTVSQTGQNRRVSGDIFARWIEDYQDVKALHVDDMSKLPPGYLPGLNRITGEPAHTLLLLPINCQSDLLGFLSLEDIPPSSYWQKEGLSLLGIVAQIIGSGLERARMMAALEERIRDRTTELKVLYEVASLASKPLPVEGILKQSLEKLLEIRKRETGFIQVLDEHHGGVRLLFSREIPAEVTAMAESRAWQQFILTKIIQPNTLVVIPDLSIELGPAARQILTGFNAMLGVPVRDGNRARGALVVLGERYRPISAEQMALISAITDQIQVAVESTALRQQVEETAIIEERQRLARDLHDSVTQSLYSMGLLARGWQRGVDSASPEEIKQWFKRLGDISTHAMKEMRLLLYDLRPLTLQQDGLEGALRRRLEAVEGKLNVKTQLRVDRSLRLNPGIEQELYHIAQESLNNILKYSEASLVSVVLSRLPGWAELEIDDNGVGFDLPALEHTRGIGLVSMRERTEKLGGSFEIDSKPGMGTRVHVRVPFEDQVSSLFDLDP